MTFRPVNLTKNIRKAISENLNSRRGWLIALALASVVHVSVTVATFGVGRAGVLPGQFDRDGFGTFASDSRLYREDVASLADKLKRLGFQGWISAAAPLHLKFYSLSHFFFSPWTRPNVLTVEPLNLLYYLMVLGLVYHLASTVFCRRTGILSMMLVAFWPSFLMHTTQLVRDPLVIVAILILVISTTNWLSTDGILRRSLIDASLGVAAILTIWIVRLAMWDAVRVIYVGALALLIVRILRQRRIFGGHIICASVLGLAIVLVPMSESLNSQRRRETDVGPLIAEKLVPLTIWERIGKRREEFANLRNDPTATAFASNIDEDVKFDSFGALISYLPRAAIIGFWAPFPNLWFERGLQVGRGGRMIAGLETLLTYILEILALIGLWHNRKSMAAWFLMGTTMAGMLALGLVVLNIGSLYRFRYPFLMLLVMLAASGAISLQRKLRRIVGEWCAVFGLPACESGSSRIDLSPSPIPETAENDGLQSPAGVKGMRR